MSTSLMPIAWAAKVEQADTPEKKAQLVKDIMEWIDECDQLRAENENHVMQLAAIMTASMQNTESTVKDRIDRSNPYWTVAYQDVCTAVDREMKLRAELAESINVQNALHEAVCATNRENQRLREALDELLSAFIKLNGCFPLEYCSEDTRYRWLACTKAKKALAQKEDKV